MTARSSVVRASREGGRQRYDAKLILVRLDQHIVWVGDSAPDDSAVVMRNVTDRA